VGKLKDNSDFIPRSAFPLVVGRAAEADLRLTEPSISRLHAVLEDRDGMMYVKDLESRFGTYVNGVQIRDRRLFARDHVRFGRFVTFEVGDGGLSRIEAPGIGLEIRGLEITVGDRLLVTFQGFNWTLLPGRVAGILGPSGAGKTMLLRALAGVRPPSKGTIASGDLPDIWQDIDAYRQRLAFIPQDDVVYPLLTVRENLFFAAQLRLSEMVTPDEQTERIEAALELFGLSQHAEKPVAVLSGGQRKRLSIAMEWIRNPKIFLLDEPTAGLDPANEARVMEHLVQVAHRGASVICTTHLMQNIYLLDEILVLGVYEGCGTVAFFGPPQELLPSMGCRNFADVYERLERGDFTPLGNPVSRPAERASSIRGLSDEPPSSSPSERSLPPPSLQQSAVRPARELDLTGLNVVVKRSLLNLWRDRWMRWMVLVQPAILGLVISLTQFNPGRLFGLFFFSTVVACWLGMNNSIRDLVRERRNYIRDRLGGLSSTSYLLAKLLTFGLLGMGQLVIFLALLYTLTPGVLPETLSKEFRNQSFPIWFLTLWLTYLGGLGLAFVISTIVNTEDAAVAWLPIAILPQILFSASATGAAPLKYTDARPFRPLVVTLYYPTTAAEKPPAGQQRNTLKATAVCVDLLSMALVCRPGVLIVEQPKVSDFNDSIWIADLCHLVILVSVYLISFWIIFRQRERFWPALMGY